MNIKLAIVLILLVATVAYFIGFAMGYKVGILDKKFLDLFRRGF